MEDGAFLQLVANADQKFFKVNLSNWRVLVVYASYWSITEKRVHPPYLRKILRDSYASRFQW